jgi:hypothetical protein
MSDAYSILKPGTRCIIVAGCPKNIGLVVQVVQRHGSWRQYKDAYEIQTISGRQFPQLWSAGSLLVGWAKTAITERYKLRPLVDVKAEAIEIDQQQELPLQPRKKRWQKVNASASWPTDPSQINGCFSAYDSILSNQLGDTSALLRHFGGFFYV